MVHRTSLFCRIFQRGGRGQCAYIPLLIALAGAFDEWVRTRYAAFGTDDWSSSYQASELFCRSDIVHARNEAASEMNSIMMELLKHRSHVSQLHADYDAAQIRYDRYNTALGRELLGYLREGELFAKSMPLKDGAGKPELLTPAARWRVKRLDLAKGPASGAGWTYIGLVIGCTNLPKIAAKA